MKKKINLLELLKYCPKGMELDNNDTQIITQDGEPIIELKLLDKDNNDT